MFGQYIQLAAQFYWQQRQQPAQRLYRYTQVVLMVFIITLSLTANNIQSYLSNNLQSLLGADVVISQSQPLSTAQLAKVTAMSDEILLTQQLNSTLTHQQHWQRVRLKAVNANYPLQGQLLTSHSVGGPAKPTASGPSSGEIWLEPRLIASLGVSLGQTIDMGDAKLLVSRIVTHEPDRLMEGHNVDMRALINRADLPLLSQTDDLIHYRYLIKANSQQTQQLIQWQRQHLPAAQLHHKRGNHPLALFWKRTENVLGLASIILFFMAAIAIDLLSQVHVKQEQYFSAVCMSLGASRQMGIAVSCCKWLLGLLSILPLVLILSALLHYWIMGQLSHTFVGLNWQIHWQPLLQSVLAVWAIFAIFQIPVWLMLYRNSVALLFNRQEGGANHWLSKLSAVAVLSLIALIYSDNALLTTMMVTAILSAIVLMIAMSWSLLSIGERLTARLSGLLPFALFMMKQRIVSKSTQIIGVGLCAFLLLFTLMLLRDIGATMQVYQRQHDGNLMVSQATQVQMQALQQWADEQQITVRQHKPYLYANVVAVNQTALANLDIQPSDSLATLSRPIRLHWQQQVPSNNRIVAGQWWQADTKQWQQLSVEQEVMTDLGLAIGDRLSLVINNRSIDFTITASHVFRPGHGSITFWLQAPPELIDQVQARHYAMASLELQPQHWSQLPQLWQQHPSLRMVSLQEMTQRFDTTLAMITKVISGFTAMIILLAIIVILASISALQGKEGVKNSLIISFGFSRATCQQLNVIEWLVTASIAALGAIAGTSIAGQLIYQSQFSLSYQPDWVWLLSTVTVIAVSVTALGLIASRHSLRRDIRSLYQQAQ